MSEAKSKRREADAGDWEEDVASAKEIVDSYDKGIAVATFAEMKVHRD